MMHLALVRVAASAVLGALAATPLELPERTIVAAGIAIVILAPASGVGAKRVLRASMLAALVLGAFWTFIRLRSEAPPTEARTARYWASETGVQSCAGSLCTVVLDLESGPRVLATLQAPPQAGARLLVRGRLEPLDESRNPGEPSEAAIEAEHGISGRLESATVLARSGDDGSFRATLARLRAWALDRLKERLGEPGASIVAGELWGERGSLDPQLRTEFQETGTVHVLITAGLHVGLVATLLVEAGRLLTLPRSAACAIAFAGVWAFAILSGADLPALRAATMASAALLARAGGRAAFSWNALALAAIAIVAISPLGVGTASFWLSFCCVGAIFACAPAIETHLDRATWLPHRAREALTLTLATQLGTWPLTAAVFLQFTPYALLGNLAVVPTVPVTMALGAAQLALCWCGPLAQAAANLNGWIIAWMTGCVHLLATLPAATLPMTPAPSWCIAAYEAALVAAWPLVRRGGATLAVTALGASAVLVLAPPRFDDGQLRITVLDVGQADAIVIETPTHHAILVDAGGRLERGPSGEDSAAEKVGERIVVPFLLRRGIHRLDALVLSHPHGDHVGGCAPVLRKIRVDEIADGGQVYGGHAYHDCLDVARSEGVPVVQPRAGMEWRTDDGVTLHFIGPSLPFIGGKNAINDNSVAFIFQYRRFRMLFTGDAGIAAEQRFLAEGIDLHADVLKVGHHGSAYSSSPGFIEAVHPREAIISVGRHNLFGHPAPSTIETLQRFGAEVYRTDKDAAVSVVSDGSTFQASLSSLNRMERPSVNYILCWRCRRVYRKHPDPEGSPTTFVDKHLAGKVALSFGFCTTHICCKNRDDCTHTIRRHHGISRPATPLVRKIGPGHCEQWRSSRDRCRLAIRLQTHRS
jgi:competence protein ComEC